MTLDAVVRRVYRRLANRFPDEFRQQYGSALADAADDAIGAAAARGRLNLLLTMPRLVSDVAMRLVVEHARDGSRDTRHALRVLRHAPGFSLAALVCLAIGIGLATAMFSQVEATVLRAIAGIRDPQGVVRLHRPWSFPYFEALPSERSPFADAAAYMSPVPAVIREPGVEPQRVWAHVATPNYFTVLGTPAAAGRTWNETDAVPGSARVVVLSYRLWRTRYAGHPSVVGRSIQVNGESATIAGVAAAGFLGASPTAAAADLWIPTTAPARLAPELGLLDAPHRPAFEIVGRLKPGVSVRQAEDVLEQHVRASEIAHADPQRDSREPRARLLPGGRMLAIRDDDIPKAIGFPLVLVSLVLLMACGNVANMLLARSAARRREIAVRLSLGAGPSRIVRQLITESVVLTVAGAMAGLAVAYGLLAYFESLKPLLPDYGHFEVGLQWTAFAAAAGLAATFIVLFGLAPARRAGRDDISAALKPNGSPSRQRRSWMSLQNVLVFQQVTASVMLLLLTGFIVVGWQRSAGVDVGFDARHLYVARIDPIRDGFTPARARAVVERLPERLRQSAGVTAASVAQTLPLALSTGEAMLTSKVEIAGGTSLGAIRTERVGAGFFGTIGAPILRGREFVERDQTDDARVIIVNDTMARALWPGEDALGRIVDVDGLRLEVVGVAADLRSAFPLAPLPPTVYRPLSPAAFATPSRHGIVVLARLAPGVDAATRLGRDIEATEPDLGVFQVTRLTDDLEEARYLASFATVIYGGMGVFGLALASIGLAGVTAQAVARRRREIGIRMALGATRANVLWLVLRGSGTLVLTGTIAGLLLALVVTRALASVVETLAETTETTLTDPMLLIGGPALLAMLALLACYLPARQSIRINPTTALRAE